MILARLWLLSLLLCLPATLANAGAVRCRIEGGVLIAPAQLGDIAGDFIIDTGAPRSTLAETQAQGAGLEGAEVTVEGRLAGEMLGEHRLVVADLDARTGGFVTPIAGVIGVDILRAYVVDIRFAPCWIALRAPDRPYPSFAPTQRLALDWKGGAPTIAAAVSDGAHAQRVSLVIATGLDAAVRLNPADVSPASAVNTALLPAGSGRAKLRALSFAGELYENLAAGLTPADSAAGALGVAVLSRFRLRLDFLRNQALLSPR